MKRCRGVEVESSCEMTASERADKVEVSELCECANGEALGLTFLARTHSSFLFLFHPRTEERDDKPLLYLRFNVVPWGASNLQFSLLSTGNKIRKNRIKTGI